jgi:hypothetical protein
VRGAVCRPGCGITGVALLVALLGGQRGLMHAANLAENLIVLVSQQETVFALE